MLPRDKMKTRTDVEDDFLETVFMNEERCQDEGFLEGQADGRHRGLQEGFHLGCQKGAEIGAEVGFYLGFTESIKSTLEGTANEMRALKAVENLQRLIEAFSVAEPNNPTLQEQIQAIRAKFKQVTSLVGIHIQFTSATSSVGSSF